MVHALPSINNKRMPSHLDANPHPSAWLSSAPPRRVLGSLVAYVAAVFVGIAAVAALATAGVPVNAWITPL